MFPNIWRKKYFYQFFIIGIGASVLLTVFTLGQPSLLELAEVHKCPACYGETLCPLITNGYLTLSPFSLFLNAKNVFYAHNNTESFVLKKLGHDWELDALDSYICQLIHVHIKFCVLSDILWRIKDVKSAIFNVIQSNKTIRSSLTFCPALDVSQFDKILERVTTRTSGVGYKTLLTNILSTLVINPEPIILQAFPAEEGWPFPQYLGSCGRITAQRYAGISLGSFQSQPWHIKAQIALQLLLVARQLTFQDPHYGLYLTDVSLDNIVVDANGKLRIIDLGNVILVDKEPPMTARQPGWSDMHTSDILEDCDDCFAFSMEDLCTHQTSDHNYYAVCQFLNQQSWLANPPTSVMKSHPQLGALLQECLSPEMVNGRYIAARHLIPILTNLTQGFSF